MGHTFRRNSDYGYKNDYRERNDRKLKKLNKRLRKITNQKRIINTPPPQEGSEFI
jgi:hypothetical protein